MSYRERQCGRSDVHAKHAWLGSVSSVYFNCEGLTIFQADKAGVDTGVSTDYESALPAVSETRAAVDYGYPNADPVMSIVTADDIEMVRCQRFETEESKLSDVDYIINVLLPSIEKKMRNDAEHYGETNHHELGLKGQFADMYRKILPLKRAMWDDIPLIREQPREIVLDLIGHCLLTLALMDSEDR